MVSKSDSEEAQNKKIEQKGMVYERSCTDCLCCVIFLAFIVAMIGVSGYAIANGNPAILITPFDSDGNQCGKPNQTATASFIESRDFTEYRYKFYTDVDVIFAGNPATDKSWTKAVCVKYCPTAADVVKGTGLDTGKTFLPIQNMATSNYTDNYTMEAGIADANGLAKIAMSDTIDFRGSGQCIVSDAADPENYKKVYDEFIGQINVGFGSYINSVAEAWEVLVIMAVLTLIITLLYVYLLRCITKPLLYGSLLLIFLFLGAVTGLCYQNWDEVTKAAKADAAGTLGNSTLAVNATTPVDDTTTPTGNTTTNGTATTEKTPAEQVAMGALVASGSLWLSYIVCLCCTWKAIALGAAIMETASEFIGQNKKLVFFPFLAYVLCVPILLWWIVTAIMIYGLGEPKFQQDSVIAAVELGNTNAYMFLFEMFGLFWIVAWIIAVQIFVTGAVACMWYFGGAGSDIGTENKDMGTGTAIKWAFRYHLGSLAWGSFLVAVITMIRVIFEYIVYQYEKTAMKDNVVFKAITCYVRCILKLMDTCIKYINKNAYIQVALHNRNFCTGAKESFFLMARNPARFNAVAWTGAILLFIGKALISSGCGFLTITLITAMYGPDKVEQPFIPAIFVVIFAYMISSVFLTVFDFSALTILHCFCLDEEQGGSRNTPDGLKKFLDMDPSTAVGEQDKANSVE